MLPPDRQQDRSRPFPAGTSSGPRATNVPPWSQSVRTPPGVAGMGEEQKAAARNAADRKRCRNQTPPRMPAHAMVLGNVFRISKIAWFQGCNYRRAIFTPTALVSLQHSSDLLPFYAVPVSIFLPSPLSSLSPSPLSSLSLSLSLPLQSLASISVPRSSHLKCCTACPPAPPHLPLPEKQILLRSACMLLVSACMLKYGLLRP